MDIANLTTLLVVAVVIRTHVLRLVGVGRCRVRVGLRRRDVALGILTGHFDGEAGGLVTQSLAEQRVHADCRYGDQGDDDDVLGHALTKLLIFAANLRNFHDLYFKEVNTKDLMLPGHGFASFDVLNRNRN